MEQDKWEQADRAAEIALLKRRMDAAQSWLAEQALELTVEQPPELEVPD